jgi:hypothetical protein
MGYVFHTGLFIKGKIPRVTQCNLIIEYPVSGHAHFLERVKNSWGIFFPVERGPFSEGVRP